MPVYMARIIGTGSMADPFRPDLSVPFAAAVPSLATGTPTYLWALCATKETASITANRELIPSGSLSALTGKQRKDLQTSILTKFGITVDTSPSRTGEDVAADVHAHLTGAGSEAMRVG